MKKGKLIVIEGTDGSGKETQTKLLYENLQKSGYRVKQLSFPNYKDKGSTLVKMYLNGEFGENAKKIDPYIASTFFSMDRVTSFINDWKEFYESGGIILSDRYITSNFIHQMVKIKTNKEQLEYLKWLKDFEYNKLGIPSPDIVYFLNVEPEISDKLRSKRLNKITKEEELDIHESNKEFMIESYNHALKVRDLEDWVNIECTNKKEMKSIKGIQELIFDHMKKFI